MPALVAGIHVFLSATASRRGWPGIGAKTRFALAGHDAVFAAEGVMLQAPMSKPGPISAKPLSVLLSDVFSDAYAKQGFAARELVTRWAKSPAPKSPPIPSP